MSAPGSHAVLLPQRLCLFCGAVLMAALAAALVQGAGVWFSLAAIAIAVWHGAFDGVLAEQVFEPSWGSQWRPWFYGLYLLLAAGVLLLWWCAPVPTLVAFLLYSALHFGTEAERELSPGRLLVGLSTGFVPIAAACHWWPDRVQAIFQLMLRGAAGAAISITSWSGRALWPALAVACIGAVVLQHRRALPAWVLLAAELLLFKACSPVVAFAVFFCLWHTPEHMVSTSLDRFGTFQRRILLTHLRRGLLTWLVSLGAIGVACWWGRHEVESYVRTLFIALSALTVPHMVLAELCRRARLTSQQPQRRNLEFRPRLVMR